MKAASINQSYPIYAERVEKTNVITRFFTWSREQEYNRLLWIGIALAGHGCVFTPITSMIILAFGGGLALFIGAMAAMGMVLVTNLAAMPTRITIPVLVLSILIDLGLIATTLLQ